MEECGIGLAHYPMRFAAGAEQLPRLSVHMNGGYEGLAP